MTEQLRILVCGDVCGDLDTLYKRVESIQRKNTFNILFVVGSFFGSSSDENAQSIWSSYVEGTKRAPIQTYILGANDAASMAYFSGIDGVGSKDLAENITYLGRQGLFTTIEGLRVVFLSGSYASSLFRNPSSLKETDRFHYTVSDINTLLSTAAKDSSFNGVDLLLTSDWPSKVENMAVSLPQSHSIVHSHGVAALAIALRPRYHFAGRGGIFYERAPFRHHEVLGGAEGHVTRFIGLAKTGNSEKQRWLYAFNIVPMSLLDHAVLSKQPDSCTGLPFNRDSVARATTPNVDSGSFVATGANASGGSESSHSFFFGAVKGSKRKRECGDDRPARSRGPRVPAGPCWFCLSSPQVEKHIVVSIGREMYLALAKGGLTPDHVLVLPVEHVRSVLDLTETAQAEISAYLSSLRRFFHSKGKGILVFERNVRSQHLQLQVVPIPLPPCRSDDNENSSEKIFSDMVSASIFDVAAQHNISFQRIDKEVAFADAVSHGQDYFMFDLNDGTRLIHKVSVTKGFPLQFGRQVAASRTMLNMPERIDWKACSLGVEEETKHAGAFRVAFKPFDILVDSSDEDD